MQRYAVEISPDALRDLEDIDDYIARHDGRAKADYVIARIEAVIDSLALTPERGPYLQELLPLGIREYRQVFFKPYRVIYGVKGKTVRVYLIADGRRDMPTLLSRRMLGH
jgi:toxin ParE1/3/4